MIINPAYINCPHCGQWYTFIEVISYNTFGYNTYWSDGYWLESPFEPLYRRCLGCGMLFWREDSRTANRAMILNSDNPNNETLDGYSDFHLEEIRYLLENGVEIPRFNSELAADQFWVENELHIVDALAAIDLFGENEERLLYLRRELLHRIGHFRRDASFPWWNFRLVFRQPQLFFSNLREWYGEQKAGELFFLKYRDVYSSTLFDLIPYAESELECAEFMRLRGDFFTTLGYLWQHRTSVWKSGFAWRLVWKCAMGNRLPFVV